MPRRGTHLADQCYLESIGKEPVMTGANGVKNPKVAAVTKDIVRKPTQIAQNLFTPLAPCTTFALDTDPRHLWHHIL